MKHPKAMICLALGLLLLGAIVICSLPAARLRISMNEYSKIMEEEIPEDLRLTIYCMEPHILTRYPYDAEDVKNAAIQGEGDDTQIIVVESRDLAEHMELLRKLNASALQSADGEDPLNARLYYVFETSDGKVLEVVMSGPDGSNVFVNGIEVAYDALFVDVIAPFLTEEMRNAWK